MTVAPCRSVTFVPTGADFLQLACSAAWWHAGPHTCYHGSRLYRWANLTR